MRRKIAVLGIMVLWTLRLGAVEAKPDFGKINWMSEQYPPYNFVDKDGIPKGIIFDTLLEMFKVVGFSKDPKSIEFPPWARSYNECKTVPNTALFGMTYTDERSKIFKFVGPIIPSLIALIAKKGRNIKVSSIADVVAKKYRVGAIIEDIGEQTLKSMGMDAKLIEGSNSAALMLKKLEADRLDVVSYSLDIALWTLKDIGLNPNDYEAVLPLTTGEMVFAFHKDVDPGVVSTLQKALDDVKAKGFVDTVKKKYLQ